jgi:cell division protein FtsI (penicillin-binding protein 3)
MVAVFALVFAAVLVRAAWLQGVRAGGLDALAASQHRETVSIPARRGTIYDRTGRALAIGEQATTVYANPKQIRDPEDVAERVAIALDLDAEDLLPLLSDRSKGFVYLKRKADPEQAELLEAQNIVGLGFLREERRAYPKGAIGSEVVGYAGLDNEGLAGLELELDGVLSGSPGSESVVRDPFGRALRVLETKPVAHGGDVYLTLDETLQGQVERILAQTRDQWGAKSATAIVLDPKTGGVLAMAVEPGFDANRYPKVSRDRQRNRTVTDTYEPGSTFKVVTLGGVLESGMVTPTTEYTLAPSIQVSDRVIHDAEPRPTMTMTVAEILSKSSNVGTITLALGLGPDGLSEWIDRFGFGHKTGIDFPGESEGIVLPTSEWSGSTIGNVPIGQGIAVTPIQMASVYAAIANGGLVIEPHLVDRLDGRSAREPKRKRLVSRTTADQLTAMLRAVVREGSGIAAQVAGYSVAGKTGTAAKPDPVLGGYSTSKYVSSFVGFVPSTRPRLCILVTVDEPKGAIWGGAVAAPAFSRIADFALQYLEIPPDQGTAAATAE